MYKPMKKITVLVPLFAALIGASTARAQLIISEVDAAGSGNTNYAADWFELKNTGSVALNITGWRMDDSSASAATSVALRGLTSIAPGQIVIFLEGNATGTTDATIDANFRTAWFGGSVPAGLTVANYGGSGVGLSTSGDGVNIFNASSNLVVGVSFGANVSPATFDNTAGLSGAISQLSVVGVNGAFATFNPNPSEIGSPGVVSVVPEPSTLALGSLAATVLLFRRRK